MALRTKRLGWQPERLQRESERRRAVVEREQREARQRVESLESLHLSSSPQISPHFTHNCPHGQLCVSMSCTPPPGALDSFIDAQSRVSRRRGLHGFKKEGEWMHIRSLCGKSGCTVHEFFKRAVCNKDTVRDFDIDAAVKRFLDFKKYGLVANSYYGIPRFVIAFAEVVLYGEHPRVPRKYRVRHSTRP